MANPGVPLPPSVEDMLERICAEQSLPPLDTNARRKLASLSVGDALKLLSEIRPRRIKDLNKFVTFMAKKYSSDSGGILNEDICVLNKKLRPSVNPEPSGSPSHTPSPQLVALGELEFRKAFLVLSYIGRHKLEDVISDDEIRKLKDLEMGEFESELWKVLSPKCSSKDIDRRKHVDWHSGKTHFYHCHVDAEGSCIFQGPYLNKTRTHLQRVLGDENVMLVKFAEGEGPGSTSTTHPNNLNFNYQMIQKHGIPVAMRLFRFFVFKDGGKEEKKKNPTSSAVKCYFICMESNAAFDKNKPNILFNKTVYDARCIFMHAHTVSSVPKYMARFSLILSKTIKLDVDLSSVRIEEIEDIPCQNDDGDVVYDEDGKPLIHTDGTGFISEDLALKCPINIYKGQHFNSGNLRLCPTETEEIMAEPRYSVSRRWDPPLLIQFRLFNNGCAVKGTLLVNRKLPPGTIQIRPSMIKVESDPLLPKDQIVNSLEVVRTSNQPRETKLSRSLIMLLSYGGVKNEYFMDLVRNALEDAQRIHYNKRAALRVSLNYGGMDDYMLTGMILSGIPLNEPYLRYKLSDLRKKVTKKLKEGKLPIDNCYYLLGTSDPTGLLKRDEVCIILENGPIYGKVLVYKHPGLHFGDIHVLTATYFEEFKAFVGSSKYAIFFPTKGPRSLADEIANSDLDGDMYWVSKNSQLLDNFIASKPWTRTHSAKKDISIKPNEFSAAELENQLFQLFLTNRFQPSNSMAVAADSWLALMDRFLTLGDDCAKEKDCLKERLLRLIDIYYDALDAPKTGAKVEIPKDLRVEKYPHYMERPKSYNSTSVLGQIYDEVETFQMENISMTEVKSLPCFDVGVPEACLRFWQEHYDRYRSEMTVALESKGDSNELADEVLRKYKQILYGAPEFEESKKKVEEIFDEALAIYQVTYRYANAKRDLKRCSFAWKVAGPVLCKYYSMKQNETSLVCLPSVLHEIFN